MDEINQVFSFVDELLEFKPSDTAFDVLLLFNKSMIEMMGQEETCDSSALKDGSSKIHLELKERGRDFKGNPKTPSYDSALVLSESGKIELDSRENDLYDFGYYKHGTEIRNYIIQVKMSPLITTKETKTKVVEKRYSVQIYHDCPYFARGGKNRVALRLTNYFWCKHIIFLVIQLDQFMSCEQVMEFLNAMMERSVYSNHSNMLFSKPKPLELSEATKKIKPSQTVAEFDVEKDMVMKLLFESDMTFEQLKEKFPTLTDDQLRYILKQMIAERMLEEVTRDDKQFFKLLYIS
jgi:hypothetical protein